MPMSAILTQMQIAEETCVQLQKRSRHQNIPDFSLSPPPAQPTGLLQLEPDPTTCICYTNYLHFYRLHHELCKFESYAQNVEAAIEIPS